MTSSSAISSTQSPAASLPAPAPASSTPAASSAPVPAPPAAAAPPRRRAVAQLQAPRPRGYWIGVASHDHAARAAAGGFAQLGHGKAGPLERMEAGDGLLYYSPREQEAGGPPLMAFTALARIAPGAIAATDIDGARFFRRPAQYLPVTVAPVKPLLEHLTFIRSKTHWGAAFRFGFLRIPEQDFARIVAALGRDFARDFPPAPAAPASST